MAVDNKGGVLSVPKGVARGHILCCCAVVFICFMLTCLNLYMLSSTRSVLRRLDARIEAHPRNLQRGNQLPDPVQLQLQQQMQQQLQQMQPEGADDFILLAPSDLDNAWTTQTGRLLVPVGQPEDDDDGWKEMQVGRGFDPRRRPRASGLNFEIWRRGGHGTLLHGGT